MRRNAVKVCIRTRPTHNFAQDNIFIDQNEGTIQINSAHDTKETLLNNKQSNFKFKFDHVFHNASQSEVYDLFARDTVQSFVDGVNGAIMSYGQTGSGKSFTMIGDTQNYEHRGIAPRAVSQIFSEVNSRIEFEYKITCTYMEIYNEKIFDLLADLSNPEPASELIVAEEKDGRGTYVRGLSDIEVTSENDVLNLLFSGELARTTATHKLNRKSNRSHSIFTIYVQQRQRSGISEKVVHSKLHLVDLAGSERLKKTADAADGSTSVDEVTRKESMNINQSLTYLEQCVVALARKSSQHIPYRQSKLTSILKDCLGANCNTLMFACVWGEAAHIEETVSTLRLASRMMRVQNETVAVETIDESALIKKQAKLIKALKQELLMHDALVERTGVGYEPYTPEQQMSIKQMLLRYVDAPEGMEEDMLAIDSYRQMLEICKQFKMMILGGRSEVIAARNELETRIADGFYDGQRRGDSSYGGTRPGTEYSKEAGKFDDSEGTFVGESDSKHIGFAMGIAPADARPTTTTLDTSAYGQSDQRTNVKPEILPKHRLQPASRSQVPGVAKDGLPSEMSGNSFELYIRGEGAKSYGTFTQARTQAKEVRQKAKEGAQAVNEAKQSIDRLQEEIASRKASRIELLRSSGMKSEAAEDIVDEEEFKLMKDLKEAKRSYKNSYEQLLKDKSLSNQLQTRVEDCKAVLSSGFNVWNAKREKEIGALTFGNNTLDAKKNLLDTYAASETSDQLDDQEAFERMEEERIIAQDPDSLSFFHAQKARRAHLTQNGANIRQIHKNKRNL